jgi:hypothetical protein
MDQEFEKPDFMKFGEDVAKYYKRLLKEILPYLMDFQRVMKCESASTYYSADQKRVVTDEELKAIIHKVASESYGADRD